MILSCQKCTKNFDVPPSRYKRTKFCSYECYWKNLSGKSTSPKTQFKKGISYNKGISRSEEYKLKLSLVNKGKKISIETRKKMSESRKGNKTNLWKGGITKTNSIIRGSLEYKLWRESVFKRDSYTCIFCGVKNKKGLGKTVKLQADHIKPFSLFPELRFVLDNGRTLCIPCHKTTDTYMGKIKNYKKNYESRETN